MPCENQKLYLGLAREILDLELVKGTSAFPRQERVSISRESNKHLVLRMHIFIACNYPPNVRL